MLRRLLVLMLAAGCGRSDLVDWTTDAGAPDAGCTPVRQAALLARCLASRRSPKQLADDSSGFPSGIAVSATEVFWLINGRNQDGDGRIMRAPLAGGPAVELAGSQALPWQMQVFDGGLWWTNGGTSASFFGDGAVMFAPLDGGPARPVVATPWVLGLTVTPNALYWHTQVSISRMSFAIGSTEVLATDASPGWQFAVDDQNLYWLSGRRIQSKGLDGGAPRLLADDQASPRPLVVRDGLVFWTNLGDHGDDDTGSVFMVPTAGGEPTLVARNVQTSFGLAVDDRHIYWSGGGTAAARYEDGMVMRCPRTGCGECNEQVEVLACEQRMSFHLVIDDSSVYWTTRDGVWSLPK